LRIRLESPWGTGKTQIDRPPEKRSLQEGTGKAKGRFGDPPLLMGDSSYSHNNGLEGGGSHQ